FVGQFVHGKRILEFIEALAQVRAELAAAGEGSGACDERGATPAVVLTLVGHGPLRGSLDRLVQRFDDAPGLAVDILGPLDHEALPQLLASQDALVLPSAFETWGMVVNEAMAIGLPVLGSRQAQAVEELVRDGREGWVFDAGDPDSERRAIAALLGTTPLRRER